MSVMPKINEEKLAQALAVEKAAEGLNQPKMVIQERETTPIPEEESEPEEELPSQEQLFDKPIEEDVKPKPKGKKGVGRGKGVTPEGRERQIASLAKAREASVKRRKEIKEAKLMDKEVKRIERSKTAEAKIEKRAKEDEMIAMRAKLKAEAMSEAQWDEDKLSSLMMKTIDAYMTKKKSEKPKPKQTIPNPHLHPQQPVHVDPMYYNNNQSQFSTQPQYYGQVPNARPQAKPRKPPLPNDHMSALFGNYTQN